MHRLTQVFSVTIEQFGDDEPDTISDSCVHRAIRDYIDVDHAVVVSVNLTDTLRQRDEEEQK